MLTAKMWNIFKRRGGKNTYRNPKSITKTNQLVKKIGKNSFSPEKTTKNAYHTVEKDYSLSFSMKNFSFWLLNFLLCSALLWFLIVALFFIYNQVTTSSFFSLKKIEIHGATHLTRERIITDSGLIPEKNVLLINIADVEQALKKNTMIASVSIKRRLPDAFEIRVIEREPAFWILRGGILYYADSKGDLIAPLEAGTIKSLPMLEILPGGEMLLAKMNTLMDTLKSTAFPLDIANVSIIRLGSARGVELFIESRQLTLCINPEDWTGNIVRLQQVLNDLARRGELKNTREIWASDGNVWIVHA